MKAASAVLALAASCPAANAASAAAGVSPLTKVVSMLKDMEAKGKKEKQDEEVEFGAFSQWCESTRQATEKSIQQASDQLTQLEADIAKAEADAEGLADEVAELDASASQQDTELNQASAVREKEHSDFLTTEADLSESIDAIGRATNVLRSRSADVPQSLLQVAGMTGLPKEAKATIQSFLAMTQGSSDESDLSVPKANAYESQSGGVMEMLENLLKKFQDQKLALQKAEMSAKANFQTLAQKLSNNIREDKKRSKDKTASRSQRLEDAASAKAEMETTKTTKAEDEKKLEDTKSSCHIRSVEYKKNQAVRADEITAIQKATEILSSDEVSGTAQDHLPTLVQASADATALIQLRGGESPQESQMREKLAVFLQGRAEATGSRYLAVAASHAEADPFVKVKKMIKELMFKLQEEANAEADHHAYCSTELETNKLTRENKQSEVEELSASVDKHVGESSQLLDELAELSDALAELRREQGEASALRDQEHKTNTKTVADAKAAQMGVERAMKVLREFYEKAGGDSFVQEPYTGQQSASGGVVAFLEVILSDFARLEAETNTAEDTAVAAHEKFMDESTEDIATKEMASEHKTARKADVDANTDSLKKELELTQEELTAANAYYDKLKPDCVDNGPSYEDRVRMRNEEIQSLKEAAKILDQQDLA